MLFVQLIYLLSFALRLNRKIIHERERESELDKEMATLASWSGPLGQLAIKSSSKKCKNK